MTQRRPPERETGRHERTPEVPDLTRTADASHGTSNSATRPRAGNLSSDTRAGSPG
jgi:hypothetical protein